ncbi:ankyrin repeat and EF-hand domain-containing protein 1-like isoform X2 [Diadema antillarum]|uniref:ankyrin repeat and EF-hand domain-containing protein 1-like isoform X2 n=1 Tax=Diadema antillarum TaxID=105358 RepID=UPI003A853DC8
MSFFKRFRAGKKRTEQQLNTIKETPDTLWGQDAVQPGNKPWDVTSPCRDGDQPTFDAAILVSEMVNAASRGDTTSIEVIHLQNPEIVNMKCPEGYTALHVAAEKGDLSTVQCLVNIGASSDVQDNTGVTPIMKAAIRYV